MPAPTPPSTTNSSNGQSPENGQFRVVRRRNRVPLSCAPCRTRKLKCNRGHPCDNCTKRGDIPSCSYAAPSSRKKVAGAAGPLATPDDMQNRIDRLENLVLSLMTNGSSQQNGASAATAQAAINSARSSSIGAISKSHSIDADGEDMIREDDPEDSDVNDVSQRIGVMKVDGGKAVLISDAHWYTILADIAEVKNYFASHQQQFHEQMKKVMASSDDAGPAGSFIFRAPRLSDRSEVLAPFPTKAETDRLVGRYFSSYDPSVHIIHGPTFQKQYDRHWQDPNQTSLIFLGMLYAIMTLSLQSYHRANDEPVEYFGKSKDLSVAFRRLTAQTLVLADINSSMGEPQMLEALLLHLQAEIGRSSDFKLDSFQLVSLVVRLAMFMGYHRDPAPYANLASYHGEIRRRVWAVIKQMDLFISVKGGAPRIIRAEFCDTQLPRNLFDDELHEDMAVLPPSRPITEPTPMSYMIAKARMTEVFGEIVDRIASLSNPPSYDEIMELDARLRDERANVPPHLQLRAVQDSQSGDNPSILLQRFGLELLYLKAQCILHRRFIARGRESQRFAHSRRTCIDAAMDILAHQATLHAETQPNGRLSSVKWSIYSLSRHDFVLAAMMVCLDLYHCYEAERRGRKSSNPDTDIWASERREQMMNSLSHCVNIWESQRDGSLESFKASSMLKVMVEKLLANQARQSAQNAYANAGNTKHDTGSMYRPGFMFPNNSVNMSEDVAPEHSAAMTLGLLSAGGVNSNPFGSASAPGNNNAGIMAQQSPSSGPETRGYPASMVGILNDSVPERTGLTPRPDQNGGLNNAPSPFSSLFASGMDGLSSGDIDWSAWDSFVQGSSMDPTSMWPTMDTTTMNPAVDPQLQQHSPAIMTGQAAAGAASGIANMGQNGNGGGTGGIFMGASTPHAAGMM